MEEIPILEFDPDRRAVINPDIVTDRVAGADGCVLSFFSNIVETMASEENLPTVAILRSEMGEQPVYQRDVDGVPIGLFACGVGAPLAAGQLEELIMLGYRNFIVCGGAGVLDREIQFGRIIVCTSALREEGTSYHYLPPGLAVEPDRDATRILVEHLDEAGIAHVQGRTWTTDAFYRETPAKIARRREQGCLTVEMEAAALFAVMQFRGIRLAQMLYGGDDVSGAEWDPRRWADRRHGIRAELVTISLSACRDLVQDARG
ncbi:MAG: nucleoside phosphorylase [Spirochaetota bacterium]